MVAKLLKINESTFFQQEIQLQPPVGLRCTVAVQRAASMSHAEVWLKAADVSSKATEASPQSSVPQLCGAQPVDIRISEMERQLELQAVKLVQLERKLHEERISKANLEVDFEHALEQLRAVAQAS